MHFLNDKLDMTLVCINRRMVFVCPVLAHILRTVYSTTTEKSELLHVFDMILLHVDASDDDDDLSYSL